MRLLEFGQADNGTDPQQAVPIVVQTKDLPGKPAPRDHHARKPASRDSSESRAFPIEENTLRTPVHRGPVDIENLHQRVEALEQRIRMRAAKNHAGISARELEQLKQRLQKLERNLNTELWAARQREHTMLELLVKPPPGERIRLCLTRIRTRTLPAVGRWLKEASLEWIQDRQPYWWPGFAQAWRESLDRARGISQQ